MTAITYSKLILVMFCCSKYLTYTVNDFCVATILQEYSETNTYMVMLNHNNVI